MNNKKLTARVTQQQKKLLVQHMRQNHALALGQFFGPDSGKNTKEKWEAVAADLNASGGANKTADQWKRCWIDFKMAIKQKSAAIKRFNSKTGNLPSISGPKPLDELEQEVITFIMPPDAVDGDGKTMEGGFSTSQLVNDKDVIMEEEYLDDDITVISSTKMPVSKSPLNTDMRRQNTALYSELEKAKRELKVRLSNQERFMGEVKEELKGIKEGQKRTNDLLEKMLLSLNK